MNAPLEKKISSPFSFIYTCIALAIIIFLSEELGRLVGLQGPHLKISPVWPATGLALAALLLYGWKIWPGIFVGFLAYNCLHFFLPYPHTVHGLVSGVIVSSASLIQAFLGTFLIVRYASVDFYNKLRSTIVFLVPAGVITCMTATTITVSYLYLINEIPINKFATTWITFWIGDTFGVYLLTPLIIGFVLSKPFTVTRKSFLESSGLFILLTLASFGIFIAEYPIPYMLLPFLLWATFRFNIKGATSALLLTSSIAIIATALGYGPYSNQSIGDPLFFLVMFIGVITATILILTSVLNEREEASRLLQEYNANLEQTVSIRTRQLQEAQEEIAIKEKLTSLGVLAAGISYEIKNPLTYIHDLANTAQDYSTNLKSSFDQYKTQIPSEYAESFNNNFNTIKECLSKIGEYDKQAQEIVDVMLQHSRSSTETKEQFKPVNIHNILNSCCTKAVRDFEAKTPYTIKVIKDFDTSVGMIDAMPFDLARAFTNIFDNAVYAIKLKAEQQAELYEPTLSITSHHHENTIDITIRDNGIGMSDAVLRRMFQPFFSTKPLGEGTGLGLALSHDIIVQEHHGKISATSQKGAFTQIVISLPISHGS